MVQQMEKINKGDPAKIDGYILTIDEYNYYKNLENKVNKVLEKWNEYKEQYDAGVKHGRHK